MFIVWLKVDIDFFIPKSSPFLPRSLGFLFGFEAESWTGEHTSVF
jgi:hypothetical protein